MLHKHKVLILSSAIIVGMLASVALTACGGGTPATTTTHPPTTTTAPPTTTTSLGATIYSSTSANCAFCHGVNREGVTLGATVIGPPIPASLPFITSQTEAQLATFISTHQTGPTLTAAQWAALASFLKTP